MDDVSAVQFDYGLCELRAGVELPRAGTVCWNTAVRDSGTPNFLASRREGKGRLGSFPSGTGRNARTSIHLILPILRDHCLTSLLVPLTTPPQPHPIADDEPHHRLFARASALHLRPVTLLQLLCLQNYRSCRYDYDYYYYNKYSSASTATYLLLLLLLLPPCTLQYLLAALLLYRPACLIRPAVLRLLPHSTLHAAAQPSPALRLAAAPTHSSLLYSRGFLHVSPQFASPTGHSTPAASVPPDLLYRLPRLVRRQTPQQHPLRSPQSRWREPASHRWSIPSAANYISAFFSVPSWPCEATLVQPYLPGRTRCSQSTMPRAMLTE